MSYSYSYSYYHCKSILFGVFVTVIICVAARPAENNAHSVEIPNKSDLVQMSDQNRNSELWSWRSFPKRASGNEPFTGLSHRRNANPRETKANVEDEAGTSISTDVDARARSSTLENRKLSLIAATSNDMELAAPAVSDVECKSESKPLFFKSILNRLTSAGSPAQSPSTTNHDSTKNIRTRHISATSAPASVRSQASRLEDLSRSNGLNSESIGTPVWLNELQSPDSYPVSAAAADWYPFIQQQHQQSQQQTIPVVSNGDNFVRKSHPSAILPASFGYYPYSSLDNDYYQAVAKAAAAAASRKPSTSSDKVDANANAITTNTTTTATDHQVSRLQNNETRQEWQPPPPPQQPVTKIILRPQASATAGKQGIAISAPISTAYVKRGDYVEIEYLPQSKAHVGEGGVAISRPELIIHFVDRRK